MRKVVAVSQNLVEVWAGTAGEALVVATFLEGNGIDAFVINENMGTIAPHLVSGVGAGAVRVAVYQRQADEAASALESRDNGDGAP